MQRTIGWRTRCKAAMRSLRLSLPSPPPLLCPHSPAPDLRQRRYFRSTAWLQTEESGGAAMAGKNLAEELRSAVESAMKTKKDEMSKHKTLNETWGRVRLKEHLHSFVEPAALVYYETEFEDETISVVTSYDLLRSDQKSSKSTHQSPKHFSLEFLVAISRAKVSLPLFFECRGDWNGMQILRVSLGTRMNNGFLENESSRTAMLYHMFMKRSDERAGNEEAIADYEQFEGLSSREFELLDPRLQKGFRGYLEARGIGQSFMRSMIEETLQQKDRKCLNFLREVRQWFKLKEDETE
eukprot:755815-Hanusia_phi.AAC.12